MSQSIIEFKNINLSFGKENILQNFNFAVAANEKIVIFGKSGIGKSTLLKLILGFVQADSGEIYVNGKIINSDDVHWLRKKIAYVDQDTIIGEDKVIELIREYLHFQSNQHLHFNLDQIKQLMTDFDLNTDLLEKNVNELSGGERQRIALVIALLLDRPIMVLDEVTASLDPVSKKIAINRLIKNENMTMIIVTHDQEWKKIPNLKLFDFKEKKWIQ